MGYLRRKTKDVADEIFNEVVDATVEKIMQDYRDAEGAYPDGAIANLVQMFVKRSAQYATVLAVQKMIDIERNLT